MGNADYTLEELFLSIRMGSIAEGQRPAEGAIAEYPFVVVLGEGWGRGWKIDLDVMPGTVLPEGIHRVNFTVRVAPRGETAITGKGCFYIGVGVDQVPPRTVEFCTDEGVAAPVPEWLGQLPGSQSLPCVSKKENYDQIRRLMRRAEEAREMAAEMCRPAVLKYAGERSGQLGHLPSTTFDDIAQAAWLTAWRGIDLFSGPDRPNSGFGHWLYLEARKAVQRTIAYSEGLSEEVRSIRNIVNYSTMGESSQLSMDQAHRALLLRELITEATREDGLDREAAEKLANSRLEAILEWEDLFQEAMNSYLEWLESLGSLPRDRFNSEVIEYICAGSGMTVENSRSEIVAWLYSNLESSVEATLAVSDRPKPPAPKHSHSESQIQHALTFSAPVSLDEIRDAGGDVRGEDAFIEVEMVHYLQEKFQSCGLTRHEILVFLTRSNVLTNGSEEAWPCVAQALGVASGHMSSRHVYRCLTAVMDSARAKLAGEEPGRAESSVNALTRNASTGSAWLRPRQAIDNYFEDFFRNVS